MLSLPIWIMTVMGEFAPAIYGMSPWNKIEVMVVGAILTRGQRTVSAAWRGANSSNSVGLFS